MFYIYVLKSKKDGKLYIGYSGDLQERVKKHNNGQVAATKYRMPLILVYYEAYKSKEEARDREKKLKYFGKAYSQLKRKIRKSIENA